MNTAPMETAIKVCECVVISSNGITAGQVEERQIGRCVVEECRQRTCEPEEHHINSIRVFVRYKRDERSERTFVTGAQHFEYRHDAQEDPKNSLATSLIGSQEN